MRGSDATSGSLHSYGGLEQRVTAKYRQRVIKGIVDDVLVSLDAEFERLYEGTGRQSIAPERLLCALSGWLAPGFGPDRLILKPDLDQIEGLSSELGPAGGGRRA